MRVEDREELASRFPQLVQYQGQFEKAINAVIQNCVKKHVFMPSGRVIYSVVGNSGDEFIDPDRSFCSCSNYFFAVLGGKSQFCYHLLSYRIAMESGKVDVLYFDDEEYAQFVKALFLDVLKALEDKGHKES